MQHVQSCCGRLSPGPRAAPVPHHPFFLPADAQPSPFCALEFMEPEGHKEKGQTGSGGGGSLALSSLSLAGYPFLPHGGTVRPGSQLDGATSFLPVPTHNPFLTCQQLHLCPLWMKERNRSHRDPILEAQMAPPPSPAPHIPTHLASSGASPWAGQQRPKTPKNCRTVQSSSG